MRKTTAWLLAAWLAMTACMSSAGATAEAGSFSLPELGTVCIHTEAQKAVLVDPMNALGLSDHDPVPEPVEIRWEYTGKAESFTVSLSLRADMADAAAYVCGEECRTENGCVLPVYNLLIGRTYYYTVTADGQTSGVRSFTVEDEAPRNLYVEGVDNIRDVGGWKTEDGMRVRQGMIYRSAHPNDEHRARGSGEMLITEAGLETIRALGIRTQIDLRSANNGDLTESPFGPEVNYVLEQFTEVPAEIIFDPTVDHIAMQSSLFSDENGRAAIADVMRHFADEENYPIVVNCSAGRDRTGVVTFLLNALLGVSEEDLFRDYMFSNLSVKVEARTIENYLSNDLGQIAGYEGETLSEKAYNYMLDIGLAEEEIDSIIRIMKEP